MDVEIRETFWVAAAPEGVFVWVTSAEGMQAFDGWGLVPGIDHVDRGVGGPLGREDRVHNSDGSVHLERVTTYEPDRSYGLAIGPFDGPLRHLLSTMDEHWSLEGRNGGTTVDRRFVLHARGSVAAALVRCLLVPQLRGALRRHHRRLDRLDPR